MGGLKAKPAQGIFIDGKKYKDGAYVRRKSKVDVGPPDGQSGQGVLQDLTPATGRGPGASVLAPQQQVTWVETASQRPCRRAHTSV